ncbi:MAG: DUF4290 domain-containing protein [Ferruginibacter sp.]|nr:DUF4290 domain-containing protein [Ferruginibacter sp.]
MEYNTTRNHLTMQEYGRHIQKMVEYTATIEDRDVRQRNANSIVELMGLLNPQLKSIEDYKHKLWDHLFLISDFKLDVDSPYPIPTRELLQGKPEPLPYPKKHPRFNHLGKNIEIIIEKALQEENQEKRQGFANVVAYYMKLTYSNWHKELVHDDAIQNELTTITNGALEFTNKPFVKHRVDNRMMSDDYPQRSYRKGYGQRDNRQGGGRGGNRNGGNNGNRGGNRNFKKRY